MWLLASAVYSVRSAFMGLVLAMRCEWRTLNAGGVVETSRWCQPPEMNRNTEAPAGRRNGIR